jgi:riboflavin biosynthesis pyrimidine reductase
VTAAEPCPATSASLRPASTALCCALIEPSRGNLAEVTGLGETVDFGVMLDGLGARGIGRLMVEGGSTTHTQFLTAGLADEIELAVAPFFVGAASAPRFVGPGIYPSDARHRMTLIEVRPIGDVALLRFVPHKGASRS